MTAADVITVVVCVLFSAGIVLLFVEPVAKARARRRLVPVTDSNRALRDGRARLVMQGMDPAAIAYALGAREAELADLQGLAHRLAQNDPEDADGARHSR